MANQKHKILLVEDEQDMLRAIQMRLEANDFEVVAAVDGREGLDKARVQHPNLIILDVMLPKIDGFTLCRMLKFDEEFRKVPVIMLTARIQQNDIERGKEMGADAYMTKPFKSNELLSKIKELLFPPPVKKVAASSLE